MNGSLAELLRSAAEFLSIAWKSFLALLVCNLPRKTWRRWSERMPVFLMAIPAPVFVLLSGFVLGFFGYLHFALDTASRCTASRNNVAMLELASRQAAGSAPPGPEASVAMSVSLTMFSELTFALLTPTGLLCTYLFCSGSYRLVSSILDDPRGDPLLTFAHSFWTRVAKRQEEEARRRERERREGPEVRDRVLTGAQAGLAGADLVVVASRLKRDWTPGTVLATGENWFRVGKAVERDLPVGLRTFYPLTEVARAEAFRRVVRYEIPRKGGSDCEPCGAS